MVAVVTTTKHTPCVVPVSASAASHQTPAGSSEVRCVFLLPRLREASSSMESRETGPPNKAEGLQLGRQPRSRL